MDPFDNAEIVSVPDLILTNIEDLIWKMQWALNYVIVTPCKAILETGVKQKGTLSAHVNGNFLMDIWYRYLKSKAFWEYYYPKGSYYSQIIFNVDWLVLFAKIKDLW